MNACPICKEAGGFRVKLTAAGAQHTCRKCQAVIPAHALEEAEDAPPPPAVAPSAHRTTPATAAASPDAPLDVIKAAKARVRFLNAEIRRLRKLETERDELVRLLAAAKTPKAERRGGAGTVIDAVERLRPRGRGVGN